MTNDEVVELLQFACTYDRRTIGKTDVVAWLDAARRGRWTAEMAQDALREHYARSTAFVMPGHITELLRASRRQPADYAEQRKALPRPAVDPESIKRGVDAVFAALAAKHAIKAGTDPEDAADVAEGEAGARRLVRSVPCPHCKASVSRPCVRRGRKQGDVIEMTTYHPSRVDLATGESEAA